MIPMFWLHLKTVQNNIAKVLNFGKVAVSYFFSYFQFLPFPSAIHSKAVAILLFLVSSVLFASGDPHKVFFFV